MNTTRIGFANIHESPFMEILNSRNNKNSYEVTCILFSASNGSMDFKNTSINIVEAWKYPSSDDANMIVCRSKDGDFLLFLDSNVQQNLSTFGEVGAEFNPSDICIGIFGSEPCIGESLSFFSFTGYDIENENAFVCSSRVDEIVSITYFTDNLIKVVGKNKIVYGFVYP